MSTSNVWRYWERLERPTRMICKLCSTTLSTHNCGNAKKHLRYKHGGEFIEVQMMDQQYRANVRQYNKTSSKVQKKNTVKTPKMLSIDEITALLMPKMEQIAESSPDTSLNLDDTQSEKSINGNDLDAEVKILRKTIKIRSIELVLDVEGSTEPIRLSFPFQSNTNNAGIMNILNNL